jgi:long-chain acyl-CoA synthetase
LTALLATATPVTERARHEPRRHRRHPLHLGHHGPPKGAELTHFNLFFNAYYVRTQLVPSGPESVALATLPLFHSFGQTCMQNAQLSGGGTVVLLPRFDAEPRSA